VRWQAEDDRWLVLGFEAIAGRASDFTPGSPDLPIIVDILNRIGALPLPDIAHDWTETRWDRYTEAADADLFRGETLLYTDIHQNNLLIGKRDTWAVDWSWPTRGAAFIDPALLVVQLIAAGHDAEAAEEWASGCRAWKAADSSAVDAFAVATLRMWRERAERNPQAMRSMSSQARAVPFSVDMRRPSAAARSAMAGVRTACPMARARRGAVRSRNGRGAGPALRAAIRSPQ
jgi:hypothetical protein